MVCDTKTWALIEKAVSCNRRTMDMDEAMSIGLVGAAHAFSTFDEARGWQFSTWLVSCIKSSLSGAIRDNRHKMCLNRRGEAPILVDSIDPLLAQGFDRADTRDAWEASVLDKLFRAALSPRELRIYSMLVEGYKQTEIAEAMGVSASRSWQLVRAMQVKLEPILREYYAVE